jgi:hypothetical protein
VRRQRAEQRALERRILLAGAASEVLHGLEPAELAEREADAAQVAGSDVRRRKGTTRRG